MDNQLNQQTPTLPIPYNFRARPYQVNFLSEVERSIAGLSKKRYFYQIWHRRSGKDKTNIADIVPRRLLKDPCLVKYVYPTLVMGRENLWDGMGSDGFRYMDHLPEQIRVGEANNTMMKIQIKVSRDGTSLFQIGGSDRPDKLRGGNPKLYIFSEWAEQDPYAWDVVEPILRENDGIAIFNTTPKGDNHARAMLEYAKNNPLWHVELLSARDTGVWTPEELDAILTDIIKRFSAQGRSESEAIAYFEQEYLCSFKAPVIGSYYGEGIRKAEEQGRITKLMYSPNLPVHTAWDLGMDDSMTIWFFQRVGMERRFIDYYENSGEGLQHYILKLQEKGYIYGRHYAPHDIQVRELGTGKSRFEVAKSLGITFVAGANLPIDDGISAARAVLSQCWFDAEKCMRGLNCLKNYKKEWDEKNKTFRSHPHHDWSSHGADAFRQFAISDKEDSTYRQPTDFGGVKPFFPGIDGPKPRGGSGGNQGPGGVPWNI